MTSPHAPRSRRRAARLTALAVFAVLLPSAPTAAADPERAALVAGRDFLDRYVADDGRVIRRDQGGDTVSEGQAYAMLIAVGLGDEAEFREIWSWTAANLQRPDGLLAWRWDGGRVVDRMPATDADLAAASALALAGTRFSDGAYLRAARRIGAAILANEAQTMAGALTLTPGPWAGPEGPVNGSYFMVNAMSRLWWATGDARWATVAAAARDVVDRLSRGGVGLLPDWAVLGADGTVRAVASPDGRSPRFGYEAARALVQFAVDCRPGGQELAARAWPFFDRIHPDDIRAEYDLTGRPLVSYGHPVALVGAAASADAAGDHGDADRLLDTATALDRRHPTYFGAAWIALARLWLDTGRLGGCRPT